MRTINDWGELRGWLTEADHSLSWQWLEDKANSSNAIRKGQQVKPGTRVVDLNARPDYVLDLVEVQVPIPATADGWLFWLNCVKTLRYASEVLRERETS